MDLQSRGEADRLIEEGNRAEDSGRYAEARDIYVRAVAAAPGYARPHVNLGIALEALGDLEGAAASHRAALAVDPSDPYANYNLAKLRFSAGAPAEANELVSRALESRADFREALVLRGCLLSMHGRAQDSLAAFERALSLRADFGTLQEAEEAARRLPRHEGDEALV